jgi:hypothetical protein
MHKFKRVITAIFLTVFSIILLFSAACAYLIVTPLGGKLLVRYFKQHFVAMGLMHVGHFEGTLQNGFSLKDVRIKGMSFFPDALLRIQEIHVLLPLWDLPPHYDLDIFNARIFMPNSDPVVFTGNVLAGQINGNLYARAVDLHEASHFWANEDIRKNMRGYISNVDFTIQGPLSAPKVNGSFLGDDIWYKSVLLSNGVSRVDLTLISPQEHFQMKGEITVDSGLVNVRNTNLQLSPSKFVFKGDAFNPSFDINLGAKVEDMDIHLAIKGTLSEPQLTVSSDPPMAPQEALRVLFTGNAWGLSTSPFNGVTSSQLAENFLNYSLQDINDQRQFGFKTKLTDNLKLGAEMDQTPLPIGETNTYYTRKINGEMDVTEHTSLNVSRQVLPQDSYPSYQYTDPESDTQIYLQYKKRF